MLILTAKVPRRRLLRGLLLAAALCCALTLFLTAERSGVSPASASARPDSKGVKSAADRVAYLEEWGWQVKPEPLSVQELLIPGEMDDSYQEYLAMQREQGFDLTKYAGRRVKRYTYQVTNYPTGEEGVQANLLICRGTVVGGEVLSPRLDGFLHGLEYPDGSIKNGA